MSPVARRTDPARRRALGPDDALAKASIRFGLGRFNTAAEVDRVADALCALVERLRAPTPGGSMRARALRGR